MDKLEIERPISVEFRNLRDIINFVFAFVTDQWAAKISQRKDRRCPRIDNSDGPAREIEPLPLVQTGKLTTQTPLSGQDASSRSMWQSSYNYSQH